MRLCEKCGREIADDAVLCLSCRQDLSESGAENESRALGAAAKTFPFYILAGIALTGAGVAAALFINYLVGIAVLLLTELACYIPTLKLKKAVKKSNPTLSILDLDEKTKETLKKIRSTSVTYKICKAIALVSLVAIIAVIFMNV